MTSSTALLYVSFEMFLWRSPNSADGPDSEETR